jgi:hypothetical protein
MRTAAVKYSYFYEGNPRVGQIKAVSGGERAVNGLKAFSVQGSRFTVLNREA